MKLKLGHFSLPVTWEEVFSERRFKIMRNKIYNDCIYERLSRDDGDKLESPILLGGWDELKRTFVLVM